MHELLHMGDVDLIIRTLVPDSVMRFADMDLRVLRITEYVTTTKSLLLLREYHRSIHLEHLLLLLLIKNLLSCHTI